MQSILPCGWRVEVEQGIGDLGTETTYGAIKGRVPPAEKVKSALADHGDELLDLPFQFTITADLRFHSLRSPRRGDSRR